MPIAVGDTRSIYHDAAAAADESPAPDRPAVRVAFVMGDDGSITVGDGADAVTYRNPSQVAEEQRIDASSGRALLASLRARQAAVVVPFDYAEITWWLARMNFGQLNEVAIRATATGRADEIIRNSDWLRALVIGTLQVGLVSGERDLAPLFNPEPYLMEDAAGAMVLTTEAEQFCDTPDASELVGVLFDQITRLNPAILPKKNAAI